MDYQTQRFSRVLQVTKSLSSEDALTNCISINPNDFSSEFAMCDDTFVFKVLHRKEQRIGTFGVSIQQREWCRWSLNREVNIVSCSPSSCPEKPFISEMDVLLSFYSKKKTTAEHLDQQELSRDFIKAFNRQPFAPTQTLIFDFQAYQLKAEIETLSLSDFNFSKSAKTSNDLTNLTDPRHYGLLSTETLLNFFKRPDSEIRLKACKKRSASATIIQPSFKFEDMGIGGLDTEFSAIFRRAFASRIFPPDLIEKLGVEHVRGILLFGPPGTGKTLIARQIGKMLNAREPKIVNGPEILNKYVGQSEENIRKLFADAEKEQKEKGDGSALHIIIFDELDAICKQRGTRGDSTGTGDQVVNQLLAKLDGVDQLNNILVIGMTNRKDMIDEALLRPGRLEVHMEISLPDEPGRKQIFKIHTSTMHKNKVIAADVDLDELATLTKNFSGAEIGGLIKSATSFAFNRHIKVGTMAGIDDSVNDMQVTRNDFLSALDEVRPAFGVSEEELESCMPGGIIAYSAAINEIIDEAELYIKQVKDLSGSRRISILLYGPPFSGKTALAAAIALKSDFPFIKMISPNDLVGFSEAQKITRIREVFEMAYKSTLSLVVIDKIERLVDWVAIGPRFSNAILQTLMVLVQKRPIKDRKIMIIATTSEPRILEQMGFTECFDASIAIPCINSKKEVMCVLQETKMINESDKSMILSQIDSRLSPDMNVSIGVAKLLTIIETASQDDDFVSRFVDLFMFAILPNQVA